MKTYLILLGFILSGCTAYKELSLSSAQITNVRNFSDNPDRLELVFDYSIDNFHDTFYLYTCSVGYVKKDGFIMTIARTKPCEVKEASGEIQVEWDTPLNSDGMFEKDLYKDILLNPIRYYVSIHQKVSTRSNKQIGYSKVYSLNRKGE